MTKTEVERLGQVENIQNMQSTILQEIRAELRKQTEILSKIEVFNVRVDNVEKRINNLENNQNKVAWIVITSVLLALLAIALKGNV